MRKRLFVITLMLSLSAHSQSNVDTELAKLEKASGGRIGLSAINTGNNQRIQYRGAEHFPMGCTSKVIGVAAILQKSASDPQYLQQKVIYTEKDLINWNPITKDHLSDGMTIAELGAAAISYSDNTAMNLLAANLGGIQQINAYARSIGDAQFKLDHSWPDEARATPSNGEDATTPNAMVTSLQKLALGDALPEPQRKLLTTWLSNTVTGYERIKAGVPQGWVVGDKTGTGYDYGITNDIAVIWPSKCPPIVIGVYYSNNVKSAPKRNDIIAATTRIVLKALAQSDKCLIPSTV